MPPSFTLNNEKRSTKKEKKSDIYDYDNNYSNFCVVENYIKEVDFLSLISDPHERIRIIIEDNKIITEELIP